MKIVRRIIYWMAALGLLGATFWYAYKPKPAGTTEQQKAVPIEVLGVGTDSIEAALDLTGWIRPGHFVNIASKVAGRVESMQVAIDDGTTVGVEEGLVVKNGRQIAVIDHDLYLAQLAAGEASVQAAKVELRDAEREKTRMVGLQEGGSATEQQRDKAVTVAELAAARLRLAEANLELARINLRESTITAPMDGVITAKYIDEGNLIRAGDRIAGLADIDTVKIIVALAEVYAPQIRAGTPARIMVDAVADRQFESEVYSIHPALDELTHTVQVEIRVENSEYLLKPGMFARVTLVTGRKQDVIVVPRDAILGGKINEPYVYVVEEADDRTIARKRIVTIGVRQSDKCEITEGLKEGETLVVNGMDYLADQMPVEVVQLEDIK